MSQQHSAPRSGAPGRILRATTSTAVSNPPPEEDAQTEQSPARMTARDAVTKKPATVRIQKEPLQIPSDVEPPTMGWPAKQFQRNVRKQVQDPNRLGYVLVPSPNDKELAFRVERDTLAEIERTKAELVELTHVRSRAIVAFVNTKGNGAKTSSTIWTATGLRLETMNEVTIFDGNYASGAVAQRLGLEGLTVSERILVDHIDEIGTNHGTFNEYVRPNTDGVRVVCAETLLDGPRKLTGREYTKGLQLTFDNCDYLYVDTPNDITSDQCLALLKLAHVIVFTANVGEQDSLRKLGLSMQTLRLHGLGPKVNKSVVLINNMPPGHDVSEYTQYQHEVNVNNKVIREFTGHTGPWVAIQHDRAVADARPVDYSALQRKTAQDIRITNCTILGQLEEKPRRDFKKHTQFSPQRSSDPTER